MRIIEKVIDCRAQEFHRMTTDFSDIFFITLLCNACVTWGGGPQLYEDTIPFFIHRILTYSGHQLEIKPLSGG